VPAAPWVVFQGDQDELVDWRDVMAWTETLTPAPTVVVLPGAEHFFHGRLNDLREAVQGRLV
jgi:alpha/beta superfamily hydrolase